MERLGFWPPDEETARLTANLRNELEAIARQLTPLRSRERELERDIAKVGNVQALLAEIRTARIERVKTERTARKIRRAQEKTDKAAQYEVWRKKTVPHLGYGVSGGLRYEGSDAARLEAVGLPVVQTAEEAATLLDLTTGELAWLTYHRDAATIDHYRHFTIPKKSGGQRAISAPKPKLKAAQRAILDTILAPVPVHEAAMAFRPATHIGHNAARHAGAKVLMRVDLKDFFPSIKLRRVKRVFQDLGYNEGVATLFALISTEAPRAEVEFEGKKYFAALGDRCLPQGAPTSPAITNVMCRHLDNRMAGAAQKMGFLYTRYADDLVFSSKEAKANVVGLKALVETIITDEKLEVNPEKTAILRPHTRQSVTGLVINEGEGQGARVSREQMRKFRAFLHGYETQGREAMTEKLGQDSLAYAQGYLSFIHMVNPAQEAKLVAQHPWLGRWRKSE